MSRTYRNNKRGGQGRGRQISARAIRRTPPDLRLLAQALLMQAADEAAAAAAETASPPSPRPATPSSQDKPSAGCQAPEAGR